MSEKDIISAVMKGDRKAFEELYRLHWANLVGYASLIAGPKHSKDIVHDIFLKVWLNRTSLQEKDRRIKITVAKPSPSFSANSPLGREGEGREF